jgi:hypothetical protein
MARIQGYPGYHYALVRHPVSNLTQDDLKGRALEVLPQVLEILGIKSQERGGKQ